MKKTDMVIENGTVPQTPMRYFELCVGDGKEERPTTDRWMCIRGTKEPTCSEATEFIKKNDPLVKGHVKSVAELTAAAACSFYDFTFVSNWPIFGEAAQNV